MESETLTETTELSLAHPFRIHQVFFLVIKIARSEVLSKDPIERRVKTQIAIGLPADETNYNLRLRIRSEEEPELEIEAVGVFEFLEDGEPSVVQFTRFINEHLLFVMTSSVIELVARLSGEMGMRPMRLPYPRVFGLEEATVKQLLETYQSELGF